MEIKIYITRDIVVNEYAAPNYAINDEDCKRRIAQANVNNPFARDVEVYRIGTYDSVTGTIKTEPAVFIGNVYEICNSFVSAHSDEVKTNE